MKLKVWVSYQILQNTLFVAVLNMDSYINFDHPKQCTIFSFQEQVGKKTQHTILTI